MELPRSNCRVSQTSKPGSCCIICTNPYTAPPCPKITICSPLWIMLILWLYDLKQTVLPPVFCCFVMVIWYNPTTWSMAWRKILTPMMHQCWEYTRLLSGTGECACTTYFWSGTIALKKACLAAQGDLGKRNKLLHYCCTEKWHDRWLSSKALCFRKICLYLWVYTTVYVMHVNNTTLCLSKCSWHETVPISQCSLGQTLSMLLHRIINWWKLTTHVKLSQNQSLF